MQYSESLDELAKDKYPVGMSEACDGICTTDCDGSGLDSFLEGVDLGEMANFSCAGVWCVKNERLRVAYFFIGTEDEVRAKITAIPDGSPPLPYPKS